MKSINCRFTLHFVLLLFVLLPASVSAAVYTFTCLNDGGTNCPSGAGTIVGGQPPVVSVITVPTGTCSDIQDVNVAVNLTHEDGIDYQVDVEHNATNVALFDEDCDGDEDMDVVFDDAGSKLVCATPVSGTYKPSAFQSATLAAFNGASSDGSWSLIATGTYLYSEGQLNDWGLTITCADPVSNATPIPTLSWWSILILLTFLLSSGWLVMFGSRKS